MNWSKLGHFLVYSAFQMHKSTQIFLQTSPDISSQKIIAQYSFFYTVIPLNIKWSHVDFAIQIMIFLKKFFNMFEKIILFCTSIYIWKLISQKTQNNFFSAQIIVQGVLQICEFELCEFYLCDFSKGSHNILLMQFFHINILLMQFFCMNRIQTESIGSKQTADIL